MILPLRWLARLYFDEERCVDLFRNLDLTVRERAIRRIEAAMENDYRTLRYHENVGTNLIDSMNLHAGGIEGQRLLEIGPGAHHVVGVLSIVNGAQSYVSVDFYPMSTAPDPKYMELLRSDIERGSRYIRCIGPELPAEQALERFDSCFTGPDMRAFVPERVRILTPVEASSLPFEDEHFDLVFSNAVLEHVFDPDTAIGEVVRVLRPGGRSMHQIDYRDHIHADDPWHHLRFSDDEWEAKGYVSPQYVNRYRHSYFVELMARHGLDLVSCEVGMREDPSPERVAGWHESFRGMSGDDRATLSALLVAVKPPRG